MSRYRQITCLTVAGLRKRDLSFPTDRRLDLSPGETRRLCDIAGAGRIVRLWITLPTVARGPVLRQALLRMYWDDETTPSVECPLGDYFGAAFGKATKLVAGPVTICGGGYVSRFQMPFNKRAVIEVQNQSRRRLRLLFFQVGYYEEEPSSPEVATFHARWRRQNPTLEGKPFLALQAKGRGRLVGLRMDMQNRSWWLRPPLHKVLFPGGLGLGMLEGAESVSVDGETPPTIVGTGTEDFFLGGWYFTGGRFCTPTHGVAVRSFLTGRVSAYRFLTSDPIPFDRCLEVVFDHGPANDVAADYACVAYWYQTEPHANPSPMPDAADRLPASVWRNVVQFVLALTLVAAAITGACWLLAVLWRHV